MKINKIIAALFIFLLSSSTVFSQKNEISIPDVSVVAGGTITLPVYLDNTEDIVAVQFTLELAEGFSLQTDAATLTERANAHSIVIKETAHNKYMVMVFSTTNSSIVGRTGILLNIPLSAQANMKDQTTYPMSLSDVVIAGNTGDNLVTNSRVGEITIAASADFEVSNVTTNTDILTPNGKIIVNWQVANVGGQASYAGWKENIYIEIGPGCVHLGVDNVHKVGAIGKAGFGWEVKIVDENGNSVERGDVGELCVKGDGVMTCYYKDEKATNDVLRDGWLFTGDMATEDEDGFIYLVDRKKDVIISGGENLYPVQIEDFLRKMEEIKDAAVIGLPDARLGEAAAAIIEVREGYTLTKEQVEDFCTELPRYKRPRHIIFADIPRNPTGKIEKPKLREIYGGKSLVAQQTTK